MNKKLIGALIAIVVVICGYLYATPYLALNNIKKAAQAGDSDTVSKYIDYPSVRQSFKDQMNAQMAKELMNQDNDGFAALGAMLASTMVDKMLDALVTPQGMTVLLQGKNLKSESTNNVATTTTSQAGSNDIEYLTTYQSFSRFNVIIHDKTEADNQNLTVKMQRDGLSWQVKAIEIPLENSH